MKLFIHCILCLLMVSGSLHAQPINVVTSFSVLADMVKEVGGHHVRVKTLVGPNSDPHVYQPTPQDSVTVQQAAVVFINGLGLEGWLPRFIKGAGYQGPVVKVTKGIHPRHPHRGDRNELDPHAWNSAQNAVIYVRNIKHALQRVAPQYQDDFQKRGQAYIDKLQQLDQWAIAQFADIPPTHRNVLTSHNAFGYFSDRYQVTFFSPVGLSTNTEPNAATMAQLIAQIKKLDVKCYFIENQTNPRLVQQIARTSGARPCGKLYPEALSTRTGPAATYIGAFKHNVNVIVASMQP